MERNDEPASPAGLSAARRGAARGGALTLAAQAVKFVIRLASQILVARLLTPADYGLVAMVFPILAFVQIVSSLGLGQATIIGADVRHEDVSALFWLGLALNVAMCAAIVLISPLIGLMYRTGEVVPVAIVLAFLIPIAGLATQPAALLNRGMRFQTLAVVDIVPPAVGLAGAYWGALQGFRYWSLVIGSGAEALCGVVLIWLLARWLPGPPKFEARARSMVRSGGHLTIYNLAVYATTSVDNILLGIFGGKVVLGLYDKGYKLVAQPLTQVGTSIDRIAIPLLVRLYREEEHYRRVFQRMLEATVAGLLPGILFVMIDAAPLTRLALGERWISISAVVSWLCVGAVGSIVHSGASWLFKSQNRTQEQLRVGLIVAVISIASFVAGLPWGAAGVAGGAGLSFLFVSVPYTCWAATRQGPVSAADLVTTLRPIVTAGIVTALAVLLSSRLKLIGGPAALLVDLALSYVTFLCLLLMSRGGRAIVMSFWRLGGLLRAGAEVSG